MTESAVVWTPFPEEFAIPAPACKSLIQADELDFPKATYFDARTGLAALPQGRRIRSGKQTITLTVTRKPARTGVDPYDKLIDGNSDDDLVEIH